jgi:phosphohistidine phosphatase
MKTLILIRHAKSSWAEAGVSDADRPLNERGKKDAPEMAERLKEKGLEIGLFLSSTAKRARKTARYFAAAFGKDKEEIQLDERLYLAEPENFKEVLSNLDDSVQSLAIFAHNPGITVFASSLTNVRIDDMPTCAMFGVQADTDSWKEFALAEKRFLFFDYPKNPLG